MLCLYCRSRARQIMITTPWLTSAHPVTQLILNPLSNEVCSHLSIVHVQIAETNPPSMPLRWPSFLFCAFHRYSWNTSSLNSQTSPRFTRVAGRALRIHFVVII